MPTIGDRVFLRYYAYDTNNRIGKTGDLANHTIKLQINNNAPQTPIGTIAEISATLLPGWYGVELDATEVGSTILIGGKSSTAGVIIQGSQVTFEDQIAFPSIPTPPNTTQIASAVWGRFIASSTEFVNDGTIGKYIVDSLTVLLAGSSLTAQQIVDAIKVMEIETGFTFQDIMKFVGAFVAGLTNGGGTDTLNFRNLNDTVDRIKFTLDRYNNRTAVVRDKT